MYRKLTSKKKRKEIQLRKIVKVGFLPFSSKPSSQVLISHQPWVNEQILKTAPYNSKWTKFRSCFSVYLGAVISKSTLLPSTAGSLFLWLLMSISCLRRKMDEKGGRMIVSKLDRAGNTLEMRSKPIVLGSGKRLLRRYRMVHNTLVFVTRINSGSQGGLNSDLIRRNHCLCRFITLRLLTTLVVQWFCNHCWAHALSARYSAQSIRSIQRNFDKPSQVLSRWQGHTDMSRPYGVLPYGTDK